MYLKWFRGPLGEGFRAPPRGAELFRLVGIPELQVATFAGFVDRAADLGDLVEVAGVDGADRLERRRVQHVGETDATVRAEWMLCTARA